MFKLQRLEITGFKSFADYTEIVFTGKGITAVVGPNGCGKCVSGETPVTLSNGDEVEIKSLVDSALDKAFFKEQFDDGFQTDENPEGIEILSLNPKTLKLEPRIVSSFIKRETTKKLLLVKTKSGKEIKATPYHPLFTLKNGELHSLRAEELKIGVRIALPRVLPTKRKIFELTDKNYLNSFESEDNIFVPYTKSLRDWTDKGRLEFSGFTKWADESDASRQAISGLRNQQSVNIAELNKLSNSINELPPLQNKIRSNRNGELNLPKIFSADLARFLGLLIAEGRNTNANQVWFVNADKAVNQEYQKLANKLFGVKVSQNKYKKGVIDSLIYCKSLCKTLEKVFDFPINSNSFEKEIPAQLLQVDEKTKWAFLSGLFEGDGYLCSRKQKSNGKLLNYIEYSTASEKLAKQVISILLQLGVVAYLRPKQKYASNTKNKTVRTYYSVLIYGSKQLKFVADNLDFVGKKQETLKRLRKIEISNNPNYDLVPTATELVRNAVQKAKIKIKPNRLKYPKIAAYTGRMCNASRNGLNEVIEQIRFLSDDIKPADQTLDKLETLANSDIYWDEIISVEEVEPGEKWVYDLSIDETHNFVAGNIIVHNSNVSDAISWVLGEQKAKSLRGQEMKDVIFQGTDKRNPSGMSEVILHLVRDEVEYISDEDELEDIDEKLGDIDEASVDLDEIEAAHLESPENPEADSRAELIEDETEEEVEKVRAAQVGSAQTIQTKAKAKRRWRPRNFALDFAPGEAVSVSRRLYLSGESEYLLNDKPCRLRDIQDLFAGTGLSGSHYAIIEQGRIGQILSSKPSNRRSLIEEAAGISKFRTRQRAAESRLESAKINLSRITDIVSEIEKQTRSLRRQANKTRRYKVLREELRGLLKQTYAAEGQNLSETIDVLDEKLDKATKIERDLFEKVAEKDEAFRSATQTARIAEEKLTEVRAKHAENALRRDRAEREERYQLEQIEELKSRSAGLKGEIKVTSERIRLLENEIKRLEKAEEKERNAAEKEKSKLQKAENVYRSKLKSLRQIESELETERNEQLNHTAAVERLAEIERQFESNLERLSERIEGLQREGERAEETLTERKTESATLEKELKTEKEKLEKLHREKQEILKQSAVARDRSEKEEENLNKLNREFSRQKHRLETLAELEEKRAIYAPSVQKLFAEQKKIGVVFQGTLADSFDVDIEAEQAVENLFGVYLQTVLVKTERDAKKVIKYLNQNGLGRIPILISEKSAGQSPKSKSKKPTIADYLGISKSLADTLSNVFPRQMSAKIVENIDQAKAKKDEIFVTLDGDLIIGGKLFVSGKTNANEKNNSLLAFKRELRELEKSSKKSAQELGKVEKIVEKLRQDLSEKEDAIIDLQSFIVQVERKLLAQEIQSKSLAQEIERAGRHKKIVSEETLQIENEIKQITKKRKEAQANAALAEKARNLSTEKLQNINKKLGDSRQQVEAENIIVNQKKTFAEVASERQRSAKNALERIKNERVDLEERLARQRVEIEETEHRIAQLDKTSKQLKIQIAAAQIELSEEENELEEAIEHLKIARTSSDVMSGELADLNKRTAMARDDRAGLEIKQTEIITRLKNLNEKCSQDLTVTLVELVENAEFEEGFDFEVSRERVEFLRNKLENFGAINMLALEELSETEERFEFLSSQRQDIIDSIKTAEEALQEIKRRSRQKFRDAFEAINANFTDFFQELFGGGQGEMILLEAEDVLEAGIEIVAQPPGKRLQNMLLLSGGEKAMTAIALVLAIFKYRPSPFCLLDEVDAPLDDANVGRFVNRIEEMSENTQFIVITHNKRTMEAAKALYGVTMQEAGISKIVSVRFE